MRRQGEMKGESMTIKCINTYDRSIDQESITMTDEEAVDVLKELLKSVVDDTPNVDSKITKAIHKTILSLEERGSHNRETKAPDWWIYRDILINLSGIDFKSIEKALGFKLFIWQKIYILNGVFCQYGKTMASILRMLVKPEYMDTPIDYSRPPESKREKMYRDELLEIKEKLDTFGIKTRNVKMPSGELR